MIHTEYTYLKLKRKIEELNELLGMLMVPKHEAMTREKLYRR